MCHFSFILYFIDMDQMQERENILSDNPRDGIYTREGKKFITELDSTKMNVIDRYEVGKALGKVGLGICRNNGEGWFCDRI